MPDVFQFLLQFYKTSRQGVISAAIFLHAGINIVIYILLIKYML